MSANNGALMTPTLIVTRPTDQSESFAAQVLAAWDRPLAVIVSPLIQIVPIAATVPEVDHVIFTSANGAHAANSLGLKAGLKAWCVGSKTAEVARAAGYDPNVGPGDAQGLVSDLVAAHPTGSIAHIRGKHARGDVCDTLKAAGLDCIDVIAYDQQPRDLTAQARIALDGSDPVILPLFSPRTCSILNAQGPFAAPIHVVAMSDAVKNVVDAAMGWDMTVAQSPDNDAMVRATLSLLARYRPNA